jgi:hypothetical protein
MARMTYHEAAAALGITLESVRRTARKKRWAKLDSNDGLARVDVPDELLAERPEGGPEECPKDSLEVSPEVVTVLTRHIERLEDQLAEAHKRVADRDEIVTQRDAARAERDVATAQVEALRAALAAAERNGDRWHREATERRPWWRRLAG